MMENNYNTLNENRHDNYDELIKIMLWATLFAGLFKAFFGFVAVNGLSMYPTLNNGEILFINKHLVKNPKNIHRGDIIIASKPDDKGRYVVKRVIGLPEEEIEVDSKGIVRINNEILNEDYVNELEEGENLTVEVLESEKIKIPKNHYFIMGDNRFDSTDSRVYGPVDAKTLYGKVVFEFSKK